MKRFYSTVTVSLAPYQILLDNLPVKTPRAAMLLLPTQRLAEAVADEWRSQGEDIVPQGMILTKLTNTAIDQVAGREAEVADAVLAYTNDLLCYRAASPDDLVARQSAVWDPLLAWAAERYGAKLQTRTGIVHFEQPEDAVAALRNAVLAYDAFGLAALHTAVSILGSLVLGLALAEGRLTAERAFAASQLDEHYQAEKWGEDEEATQRAAGLLADLTAVERFLRLAKS